MITFDLELHALIGPNGSLIVPPDDEITRKLAMLIEGECGSLPPHQAASKFGFSRARYYQLLSAFLSGGALALHSHKRGPKAPSRCTVQVVRQIIRHRFLDPDASAEVIAQKLSQSGMQISTRSVERVLEEYGLQKKTLSLSSKA